MLFEESVRLKGSSCQKGFFALLGFPWACICLFRHTLFLSMDVNLLLIVSHKTIMTKSNWNVRIALNNLMLTWDKNSQSRWHTIEYEKLITDITHGVIFIHLYPQLWLSDRLVFDCVWQRPRRAEISHFCFYVRTHSLPEECTDNLKL